MPASRPPLNLETWGTFLSQERSNDYEYNMLLYKFRSFYNEVKEFYDSHQDCSASNAHHTTTSTSKLTKNPNNNPVFKTNSAHLTNSANGQQKHNFDIANKKSFFQNQNSFHFDTSHDKQSNASLSQLNRPQNLIKQNSADLSSSHNADQNVAHRPDVRQRSRDINSRVSLSKSSERLNINSGSPAVSNLKNNASVKGISPTIKNSSMPIPRDSKYLQNDANIYDAVSPDEDSPSFTPSLNSSSDYSNRLNSTQLKSRLETSRSSLVLTTSLDSSKGGSAGHRYNVSNSNSNQTGSNTSQHKDSNSFGSSTVLDSTKNSASSLYNLPSPSTRDINETHHYANYVNIDFFLKRSNSPSLDGLDEDAADADSSDDDNDINNNDSASDGATPLSESLSSEQICGDAFKDISPRDLARKLSSRNEHQSSDSLTPASSGDFLEEQKGSSNINQPTRQSCNQKLSSFVHRDEDISQRLSTNRKFSDDILLSRHNLGPIFEGANYPAPTPSPREHDRKSEGALVEASNTMRSFISDLNLSPVDNVFEDKAQRRIVKESFAVEHCGRRKLRHLFLFNDVIVCAKYQASSKQKFTFDVKWYLNLNGVSVSDLNESNQVKHEREAAENQILAIRTNLMLLRGQIQNIKRGKHKQPSKVIKKLKKKKTELEAELVLLLPHLPLVIKHINGKKYSFFLSSNFDRSQWIESIKFLQSQIPPTKSSSVSLSSSELQAWIQTCRKNLNPSLGTFLLRSNCDDDLLYGDLGLSLSLLSGITKPGKYYLCFELDSYGHFSQKGSSTIVHIEGFEQNMNEEYVFPLDGAHTLRILLYEDLGSNSKPLVVGKAHVELSRAWFLEKPVDKVIRFSSNCVLKTQISHSSSEMLSTRIPHAKLCPTFGLDITQVCKKEKTKIPLLIQLCVNEVERRGMREVGIYRMSGTSTDVQRLKKAFETNLLAAELLLRDIDINSVTGFLKTYLREIPEGLFINKLYLKFVAAFNIPQSDSLERTKKMLELFNMIPTTNQETITYLVEHLVKVNKHENHNKMSLTNLATVLGPNILKPPSDSSGSSSTDPFTAVVIGSMSQAGILYFFLSRRASNLPLANLESSEMKNLGR